MEDPAVEVARDVPRHIRLDIDASTGRVTPEEFVFGCDKMLMFSNFDGYFSVRINNRNSRPIPCYKYFEYNGRVDKFYIENQVYASGTIYVFGFFDKRDEYTAHMKVIDFPAYLTGTGTTLNSPGLPLQWMFDSPPLNTTIQLMNTHAANGMIVEVWASIEETLALPVQIASYTIAGLGRVILPVASEITMIPSTNVVHLPIFLRWLKMIFITQVAGNHATFEYHIRAR